jgi:ABC-2 type transport system ATP-binding protein
MDTIVASQLTKKFDNLYAVDGLSLNVHEGEIFGLVGPDGAGKTTTMRLLTAILDPTSGNAWVAGHDIIKEPEAVKEQIGYMSQKFGLYLDLTVLENLRFYGDIYCIPRKAQNEKIEQLLEFSGLSQFRNRLAKNLSGGMKQKLGLSCALIHTPKVLFLDEPTNGVDPLSRRDFWDILYRLLHEKVTIFISTAYLDVAERCNRLGLIYNGKIIASGAPDEIKKLIRGSILEVSSLHPRRSLSILMEKFGADKVGLFGSAVHVLTEDPEATESEIKTSLEQAQLPWTSIRSIAPSLEDVFISVLTQWKTKQSS